MAHGSSQQHLTSSFMPACLRCRTLVDTKVLLLYVLCCSVEGRLKPVLLCLRYVDTMDFGTWFVLLGVQKKKSRFKNESFVVRLCSLEAILLAELIQLKNSFAPRRAPRLQSCSPRGWSSPVPWLGLRRAPVSRTCYTYTNTRARFLLLAVMVLMYCGWFCCCYYYTTADYSLVKCPLSSSLVTKKQKKQRTSQKAKKAKNFGKVLFPNNHQ